MPIGFSCQVLQGWEQLPQGWKHRDVSGVTVDSGGRVYLLTRRDTRVIVYEADGTFVGAWGEGLFTDWTHCIRCAPDGSLYAVDDGDHTIRRFSPQGELRMTLGTQGVPSDTGYDERFWGGRDAYGGCSSIIRGGPPFNKPTGIAIASNGDLYVSDGYANARVHRFSAEGRLIRSWGQPGTGPGQFNLPHGIFTAPDGRVLVADRENERIQIFSADGEYLTEWTDVQRPTDIFVDGDGLVYVSELGWRSGDRSFARGAIEGPLPGRMSIFDLTGKLVARWGGPDTCAPGNFCAPHAVCVDSRGDIYVAEVTYTYAGRHGLVPADCHNFQKFQRR